MPTHSIKPTKDRPMIHLMSKYSYTTSKNHKYTITTNLPLELLNADQDTFLVPDHVILHAGDNYDDGNGHYVTWE